MKVARWLIQVVGLLFMFLIPIFQSAFANKISITDYHSFINLIHMPFFWMCVLIYVMISVIMSCLENKKEVQPNNHKKSLEDVMEENDIKMLEAYGTAKVEFIKKTTESVKKGDIQRAEDTLRIYRELDEIIRRKE